MVQAGDKVALNAQSSLCTQPSSCLLYLLEKASQIPPNLHPPLCPSPSPYGAVCWVCEQLESPVSPQPRMQTAGGFQESMADGSKNPTFLGAAHKPHVCSLHRSPQTGTDTQLDLGQGPGGQDGRSGGQEAL